MPKYYVESGNIKYVLNARNEMSACMKSLFIEAKKFRNVEFEDNFFVSQKGFLSERDIIRITIQDEVIINTIDVIEAFNDLGR